MTHLESPSTAISGASNRSDASLLTLSDGSEVRDLRQQSMDEARGDDGICRLIRVSLRVARTTLSLTSWLFSVISVGTRKASIAPVLVVGLELLGPAAVTAADVDMERAAKHFQDNCAVCHGPQGEPDPQGPVVQGLGVVPANLADALFNSREPRADWELVIEHGGAALGFSEKMPAFGEKFSDAEIRELVAYVKTLAGEHDYPPGDLNLFLPIRTRKAFPEDEVVWKLRYTDEDGAQEWKNTLEFEKRFGTRFQGILELVHSIQDGDETLEAFEPGAKYVLSYDQSRRYIATLAAQLAIPLESGPSVELLPYIAYAQILNSQFTFQGSARAKLPVEDVGEGSFEISGIVHWTHTPWPRSVFPALEFTAEIPFDRGIGPDRVDFAQTSITPQLRIGLSKRGHVALNVGVELPLNDTDRFDYRGYMYLIWDFADGPFWAGW